MKKILCNYLLGILICTTKIGLSQNVGINATGAAPDASAILDASANNLGLLIPRVSIPDATNPTPITSPAQSLLVYNTNAGITNGNGTGYYYWDTNQWIKLYDGTPLGDSWQLLGNAGTNPSTNFVGTTDAQDLVFRTNNAENMRINTSGNIDIGASFDDARLYVRVLNSDVTTNYGIYNYNDGGITSGTTYGIRTGNYSSTNSSKYGIYNYTSSEGTGTHYGIYNGTYLNASSGLNLYGFYNYVSTSGSSSGAYQRGIYNTLNSTSATGIHHGIYTAVNLNANSTSSGDCGQYTSVDYSSGSRYGEFKVMATNTSATGNVYGDYNEIAGTGNDNIYGLVADIQNSGTGSHYGIYSDVPGGTNDYAAMFRSGNVVMNEDAGNYDVRIEGTSMTNLFKVDASQNKIGIGVITPFYFLDIDEPSTTNPTYVFRARNSAATGSRTQIGSIEYFQDQSSTIDFTGGSNFSINLNASASFDLQLAQNSAAKPGSNTWTIASDARLKEDVHPFKDGLSVLKQIEPVYFKYNGKANITDENYFVGVIAQDLEKVAPYMVGSFESAPGDASMEDQMANTETYKTVDNGAMTYITINSIKELDANQKKIATQLKSISDFGNITIDKANYFIPFSKTFQSELLGQPIVTITPVNSSAIVSIVEQSADGFVIHIENYNSPISVNWIAMGKANFQIGTENTTYSQHERQEMLQKIKAEKAKIDYKSEQIEMQKRALQKQQSEPTITEPKAEPADNIGQDSEENPEEDQAQPQN